MKISDKAKQMRNEYQRAWRRRAPEKQRQYGLTYWENKADPERAKVRKLSKQGMSQRQIAEAVGISLGAVNAILNEE